MNDRQIVEQGSDKHLQLMVLQVVLKFWSTRGRENHFVSKYVQHIIIFGPGLVF